MPPASFPVGVYRLDGSIEGLPDLIEFSPDEYETMGRYFESEKNYNAPLVNFLGRTWHLKIGTAHGKIHKIAPYLVLTNKDEANSVALETLQFCNERLGKPADQRTGLFVWDTSDGNVILQTGETAEGNVIGVFLTSRSVQNLERRPHAKTTVMPGVNMSMALEHAAMEKTERGRLGLDWHWLWFLPLCVIVLLLVERHTVVFGFAALNVAWERWSWAVVISPSAAFCLSVIMFSVVFPPCGLGAVGFLVAARAQWRWTLLLVAVILLFPIVTDVLIWGLSLIHI